jgi:hypothetical protein
MNFIIKLVLTRLIRRVWFAVSVSSPNRIAGNGFCSTGVGQNLSTFSGSCYTNFGCASE